MSNYWDLQNKYYYDHNNKVIGYSGDKNERPWYIKNNNKIFCPFIIFKTSEAKTWVESSYNVAVEKYYK